MADQNPAKPKINPYDSDDNEFMADVNDPIQQNPPPPLINQSPPPPKPAPSATQTPPTPPKEEPNKQQQTPPPQQEQQQKPTFKADMTTKDNPDMYTKMPKSMSGQRDMMIIGGVVVVLLILAAVYFIVFNHPTVKVMVTTSTINPLSLAVPISNCTTITSPGLYSVTTDLSTANVVGACITVTSSNVDLEGNGHKIAGSGPYVDTPPYSYGINLGSVSNVTVDNFVISKFSYGVYINNSFENTVSNVTIQNITISGIALLSAKHNTLIHDLVSNVNGELGGISITGGGNNMVESTTLKYNSYYGMVFNSTGNSAYNDTLVGNPVDLLCAPNAGYAAFNKFSNSTCYVNHYCNFATCSEQNLPASPQATLLPSNVAECGTIGAAGKYTLTQDLNVPDFITNASNPCIAVNASNVNLDCNGFSISNGMYGIYSSNVFNLTISNCNFRNDQNGIYLTGLLKFNLHNINAIGGTFGVRALSSTGGNFTDIYAFHNTYGVSLNSSTYTSITRFNTTNNTYGISMENSTSVAFDSGTALLNSKVDLYCSADVYNSTLSTITDTQCGSTDCTWATECPVHYLPNLSTYPISTCTQITEPGQYSINTNLLANGNCFTIKASNVSIECNNHVINGFNSGAAIVANNVSNVAAFNCRIIGFTNGVLSKNTQYLVLQNMRMNNVVSGLNLTNAQSALISNDSVDNYSGTGYVFSGVSKSVISTSVANRGLQIGQIGFRFTRSINNTVLNNTASNGEGYGFSFENNSISNFVLNNTGTGNSYPDYICSSGSTSAYADSGHINNGLSKISCKWLAVIPPPGVQLQTQCTLINSPSSVMMEYDMLYPYGNTCFSISAKNATISADDSLINCEGHTIYATNGGTFVYIYNTSGVTIENCVLYGFTKPIVATSKVPMLQIHLINNTILDANVSISITNAQYSEVYNNNITNVVTGINGTLINNTNIENNIVSAASGDGIIVRNSFNAEVINNTVGSTQYALSFVNTTGSGIQKNGLNGKAGAVYCNAVSGAHTGANTDLGQNSCITSSSTCSWITSSSGC